MTRCLEIVSEASRRLSDEVKARHPGIAWADMRDAGNLYRHAYDQVTESIVWSTVVKSIPALIAMVAAELSDEA